jgi:hypothetical protein
MAQSKNNSRRFSVSMVSIKDNICTKLREKIAGLKIPLKTESELLVGFAGLTPYRYLSSYLLNQVVQYRKLSVTPGIKRDNLVSWLNDKDKSDIIWQKSVWNSPERHWIRIAVLAGMAHINLRAFQSNLLSGSDPETGLLNYLGFQLDLVDIADVPSVTLRVLLFQRNKTDPMILNSLSQTELIHYWTDSTLEITATKDQRIKHLQSLKSETLALLCSLYKCPREQLALHNSNKYEDAIIALETERAEVVVDTYGFVVPPLFMVRSYLIHNIPQYQIAPELEIDDRTLINDAGVIPCYDSRKSLVKRLKSLAFEPGWFQILKPSGTQLHRRSEKVYGYGTLTNHVSYSLNELNTELTKDPGSTKSELSNIYELYFVTYQEVNLCDFAQQLYPMTLPLVMDENREQIRKFLKDLYHFGALVRGMKPGARYPSLNSPYEVNVSDPEQIQESFEKIRKELRKHEELNKLQVYVDEGVPCEYTLISLIQRINLPEPQIYIGLSIMFTAKTYYEAIFGIKLPGS